MDESVHFDQSHTHSRSDSLWLFLPLLSCCPKWWIDIPDPAPSARLGAHALQLQLSSLPITLWAPSSARSLWLQDVPGSLPHLPVWYLCPSSLMHSGPWLCVSADIRVVMVPVVSCVPDGGCQDLSGNVWTSCASVVFCLESASKWHQTFFLTTHEDYFCCLCCFI